MMQATYIPSLNEIEGNKFNLSIFDRLIDFFKNYRFFTLRPYLLLLYLYYTIYVPSLVNIGWMYLG